jgi:hypothetical protein
LLRILSYTTEQLERKHDYIQLLFPLLVRSPFNPSAPVATRDDYDAFASSPELRTQMLRSFHLMLDFYGFRVDYYNSAAAVERDDRIWETRKAYWWRESDHNHRRISRILRSMRLLGCEREANAFYAGLEKVLAGQKGGPGRTSRRFWRSAVEGKLWEETDGGSVLLEIADDGDEVAGGEEGVSSRASKDVAEWDVWNDGQSTSPRELEPEPPAGREDKDEEEGVSLRASKDVGEWDVWNDGQPREPDLEPPASREDKDKEEVGFSPRASKDTGEWDVWNDGQPTSPREPEQEPPASREDKEEEHWVDFYVGTGVVQLLTLPAKVEELEDMQGVLENGGGNDVKQKREGENASVQPQKRRKEEPKVESTKRDGMLPGNEQEGAQATT